jgi:hypothetical protein
MVGMSNGLPYLSIAIGSPPNGFFTVKFEDEIEDLLKGSVPSLSKVAAIIKVSDGPSVELFRISQEQLKIHGQALMRLAAAIDGLTKKVEALQETHGPD